jgi:uroporphyrinogen-III synthase
MRPVLILRPEPGASATANRAKLLGLEPIVLPLFKVEPIGWTAPEASRFDGLLLTSANALRHGGDQLESLRGLQVYAVGEATAGAAREAGFGVAATGDSGVDRLLGSIEPNMRLLHLCGEDRREPAGAPQSIRSIAVYRSNAVQRPYPAAAKGAVALIHSPRAGRRFAELVHDRAVTAIAAVSPAAAESVGRGWESVEAADAPTDDALLVLATRLCNNPPPK